MITTTNKSDGGLGSSSLSVRQASWIVALATLFFVAVWISPQSYSFQKVEAYLPLHTLMETFAVVVAALIFGVGWNAYSAERPGNIVLLSCVFLAVGFLDFAHFMSYLGMPDFVSPSGVGKAILFWLVARYAVAIALLAVVILPWRPFANPSVRYQMMACGIALTALVYWAVLFHESALPETFIPGQGLTRFKIVAEYGVIFIHLIAAWVLLSKLRRPQAFDALALLVVVSLMSLGELCFTLYAQVADGFNVLGHIYKVVAYAILYRIIFVNSVREPFVKLYESRQAVWHEKERAQVTLESIGDAVITANATGNIEYLNPVAEALTGWSQQEAQGRPLPEVFDIVNEQSRKKVENPLEMCLREGRIIGLANHTVLIRRDGMEFAIEDSAAPIRDRDGNITGAVMVFHDVSERRKANDMLREREEQMSTLINAMPDFVCFKDGEGHWLLTNDFGLRLFEIQGVAYQGKKDSELASFSSFYREAFQSCSDSDAAAWRAGHALRKEEIIPRSDGSKMIFDVIKVPLFHPDGKRKGLVVVGRDITERRGFEEKIEHMVHHDILTGLPNRTLLVDRLKQALARARHYHKMVGVLLIDLDRFKTINDTLGHDIGDELLRAVSDRLARCLRGSDSAGRMGGDEFMFILSDLSGAQASVSVCEDIMRELALPFSIRGHEIYVTCSIGISIAPNDGDEEQVLMRNADAAMYRAKEQGRNTYQFYTADMNARAFERLALENSLRHALERNELRVYYQPKVNAATGKITGAEALVRWQHPDMGLVSPAKFIPLAEESGLIVPIGEFVMRTACAQNKVWQDAGFTPITMAVNLSARQLHEAELVATVANVLKETGLDASWLELELTESMLMQQVAGPEKLLRALKDIGIELSIDDFGTGFSSLSYLKRFPIDYLKIDRSFIQDVPGDSNDAAIVMAVIAMADSLNLKVVAEGVEKQEQIDFLHNYGCDDVQGFFFSQPVPSEKFTELLQQGGRFPVAG